MADKAKKKYGSMAAENTSMGLHTAPPRRGEFFPYKEEQSIPMINVLN